MLRLVLVLSSDRGHRNMPRFYLEKNNQLRNNQLGVESQQKEKGPKPLDFLRTNRVVQQKLDQEAFLAVFNKDQIKLKEALQKGANPNAKNKNGNTLLICACLNDFYQGVIILLEHNADPNIKGKDGIPTTVAAAQSKNVFIAKAILDNGVFVDEKDNFGNTGLIKASSVRSLSMMRLFLEYGANPNLKNLYMALLL